MNTSAVVWAGRILKFSQGLPMTYSAINFVPDILYTIKIIPYKLCILHRVHHWRNVIFLFTLPNHADLRRRLYLYCLLNLSELSIVTPLMSHRGPARCAGYLISKSCLTREKLYTKEFILE